MTPTAWTPALRRSDEDEPCRRTEMGAVGHGVRDGGLQRAEGCETSALVQF